MARSRNIKPGFFRNEHLAELPVEARLLFIGLWTVADREGRLEDRPRRIKMELFAADDFNVNNCLDALASAGFLTRYPGSDGKPYIQITNWHKHQNPHHREVASVIPPFIPGDCSKTSEKNPNIGARVKNIEGFPLGNVPDNPPNPVEAPDQPGQGTAQPDTSRAGFLDSLIPSKESKALTTVPVVAASEPSAVGQLPAASQQTTPAQPPLLPSEQPSDGNPSPPPSAAEALHAQQFALFWTDYPNKAGKKSALKAWRKIKPKDVPAIMSALERFKKCRQWTKDNGEYIPHASTWLNKERWKDEVIDPGGSNHSGFNDRNYGDGLGDDGELL